VIITNYHVIRYQDTLNGPGYRTVLFVAGCEHHCKGCHNPETWDPNGGKPFGKKEVKEILTSLKDKYVTGLTISGGDPLAPYNIEEVSKLCKEVKLATPDKTIWVYTGYTYEELLKTSQLHYLECVDVLVDGPFMIDKKDNKYLYAGSTNQRRINIPETLRENRVVLWEPRTMHLNDLRLPYLEHLGELH
jgi:anaerobic ribonucleoside-triphosphate reductase activating protein